MSSVAFPSTQIYVCRPPLSLKYSAYHPPEATFTADMYLTRLNALKVSVRSHCDFSSFQVGLLRNADEGRGGEDHRNADDGGWGDAEVWTDWDVEYERFEPQPAAIVAKEEAEDPALQPTQCYPSMSQIASFISKTSHPVSVACVSGLVTNFVLCSYLCCAMRYPLEKAMEKAPVWDREGVRLLVQVRTMAGKGGGGGGCERPSRWLAFWGGAGCF